MKQKRQTKTSRARAAQVGASAFGGRPFAAPELLVQPKLTLGRPADAYEQEADRVAEQVVSGAPADLVGQASPAVRRQPAPGAAGASVSPAVEQGVAAARGGGEPLPAGVRTQMGAALGGDFGGVRVHTDQRADGLNRSLQARAFTTGSDVFFRQGEYRPGSGEGQRLIAHELAHVVQQGGAAGVVQPKLMSAAALGAATGDTGARVFATSSYERLIEVLKAYEKLDKEDGAGERKTERLRLLTEMDKLIDQWYSSSQRDFVNPAAKAKAGDAEKKLQLQTLREQVVEERKLYVSIKKDPEPQRSVTTSTTPEGETVQNRSRSNAFMFSYTSPAEQAAQQQALARQAAQQSFASRVGQKIANFFHYTFGTNFDPRGLAALDPKTVLQRAEIEELLRLMDEANATEQELLRAGVGPVPALALAFQYMPAQVRPTSAKPEARLVIQVKRQLLVEALAVPAPSSTADKVFGGLETGTGLVGLGGEGADGLSKVVGKQAEDALSTTSDSLGIVEGVGTLVGVIRTVVGAVQAYRDGTNELEKHKAVVAMREAAGAAVTTATKLANSCGKLATAGKGVPGLEIAVSVLSVIDNLVHGIQRVLRAAEERGLAKTAREAASGLASAIQSFSDRNITLALRNGVEIIASCLKIIGDAVKLADPSGAGAIVSGIGTVVSAANKVAATLQDSYRSGVAQEAELGAQAGLSGADLKVFEANSGWALTAIILEAQQGNDLAVKELAVYGVTPSMLATSSVPAIRSFVLGELQEKETPETITQTAVRWKRKILGR